MIEEKVLSPILSSACLLISAIEFVETRIFSFSTVVPISSKSRQTCADERAFSVQTLRVSIAEVRCAKAFIHICAVEAISFKALLALADSSHTGGVRRTVLTVQGRATESDVGAMLPVASVRCHAFAAVRADGVRAPRVPIAHRRVAAAFVDVYALSILVLLVASPALASVVELAVRLAERHSQVAVVTCYLWREPLAAHLVAHVKAVEFVIVTATAVEEELFAGAGIRIEMVPPLTSPFIVANPGVRLQKAQVRYSHRIEELVPTLLQAFMLGVEAIFVAHTSAVMELLA